METLRGKRGVDVVICRFSSIDMQSEPLKWGWRETERVCLDSRVVVVVGWV